MDFPSGSRCKGEGATYNVKHVKCTDIISWKCDTQQDAPCPDGDPCLTRFHPRLLSRSGKFPLAYTENIFLFSLLKLHTPPLSSNHILSLHNLNM